MAAKYTQDQVSLLRRTIVQGLDDDEFELFIETCDRLGLDPFAKQIYAVKRWDKRAGKKVMSIQVSIDGFRTVAARTGEYQGQAGPFWCDKDGNWKDVWLADGNPLAAKVGVMRKGFKDYLYGVAKFKEFAQKDKQKNLTQFWRQMPDTMSAKCAEAQALRRAFPELSGIYIPEEMVDDDYVPEEAPEPKTQSERTNEWAQGQVDKNKTQPAPVEKAETPAYVPPDDEEQPETKAPDPPKTDPGIDQLATQFSLSMKSAKSIGDLMQIGKGMQGIELGDRRIELGNLYAKRRKELQPA